MDVLNVITPLIEIETKVGELYDWFSKVFESDKEVSQTFYRMASEERSHAALIRYAKRVLVADKTFKLQTEINTDKIKKILELIEKTLEGKETPSMEEAFKMASWVEQSCAENPLECLLVEQYPQLGKLLSYLGRQDREHYTRLVKIAAKRSVELPKLEEEK